MLWKSYILSKLMLELSYRNKDKITAKYLKRSHFENIETKTKKWFLRNFLRKTLLKKWFPSQLSSTAKNSRIGVFQETLALNFKWNALTFGISNLFTFFTVAQSVILDFYFILVTSNTVIWVSLFGAHRFKREGEDLIFHVIIFSRETF